MLNAAPRWGVGITIAPFRISTFDHVTVRVDIVCSLPAGGLSAPFGPFPSKQTRFSPEAWESTLIV